MASSLEINFFPSHPSETKATTENVILFRIYNFQLLSLADSW